ncbi:hypothetical protein LCGC14_3142040 [marine sediment metagenome]|uniref:Uncharacterized protein n=1 Tax=marine sediment metagenome TaxID=412755 RepID=A0A0F8YKW9_9ZZZZ
MLSVGGGRVLKWLEDDVVNGTDRDLFDVKLTHIEKKLQDIHDDVLIIQTERKSEKKFMVAVAGMIAFAITTLMNFFGG